MPSPRVVPLVLVSLLLSIALSTNVFAEASSATLESVGGEFPRHDSAKLARALEELESRTPRDRDFRPRANPFVLHEADRALRVLGVEPKGPLRQFEAPLRSEVPHRGVSARGLPRGDLPNSEESLVDMVIVTTAALESSFQVLADWKTRKGVPTVVRTLDWIDANYPNGHDGAERIRDFLRDAASRWGTAYVLLGGDYLTVPVREAHSLFFFGGSGIPTDQYFACLEGDWNADGDDLFAEALTSGPAAPDAADLTPDLFVGRAPVATPWEAAAFVTKTIDYERSPPANYVEDALSIAEVLFPDNWEFGDPVEQITLDGQDIVDTFYPLLPASYTVNPLVQSANTLDPSAALSALNTGPHFVLRSGHSDTFKMSMGNGFSPFLFASDFEQLTNGNRQMVFLDLSCCSADLAQPSTARALVTNPNGGAVGVFGTTRVSFPLSANQFTEEFVKLLAADVPFGVASQLGRLPFIPLSETDGTPDRWTMFVLQWIGDPQARLWTEEPGTLDVTHVASLELGTNDLVVTVLDDFAAPIAGARVTVSDGGAVYARALTDAAGVATLTHDAKQVGTLDVVVDTPRFLIHESSVSVTATALPLLALSNATIDDDAIGGSSGNGDATIDATETIELEVDVENEGGAIALGASVSASVDSGSEVTFDLLIDGVRDASQVFVGPESANPATVPFTLDFATPSIDYIGAPKRTLSPDTGGIGDTGYFVWQDENGWHLRWGNALGAATFSGTISTDGRIRDSSTLLLESTDTATLSGAEDVLTFSSATSGLDFEEGLDLKLADDTMLTITNSSAILGDIAPSAQASGTVTFAASSTLRDGQVAEIDLTLSSTNGASRTTTYPVVFSAPDLEAYVFSVDDTNSPPVSGNGNGVIEVGETVRLTPTVVNRGSGAAVAVTGAASAGAGITVIDALDVYGDLASLVQSTGVDGFVFTVDHASGTTIDLDLTDSVGRVTSKQIEFVAPAPPAGLGATPEVDRITLRWDANGEADLAGYNVYRSVTSGSGFSKRNAELLRAASRYEDEALTSGTLLFYQVTAVDEAGNESAPSAEFEAYTLQPELSGWPSVTASNVFSSIAIADADGLGASELYTASKDFQLYGFDESGDFLPGFPLLTGAEIWSTPALADLDENGTLEIVYTSMDGSAYAVNADGSPHLGAQAAFFTNASKLLRSTPTLADLDADTDLEILFGTDDGELYAFHHDGTGFLNASGLFVALSPAGTGSRIWGPIAVGDLDGDTVPELVFTSWNDNVYVYKPDGALKSGFPVTATGGASNDFRNGPSLADLDDDGTLEILAGNDNGTQYVWNHDGSGYLNPDGSFVVTADDIRGVAAPCNLDQDPELEIVVGNGDSNLYVWNHDGSGFLDPDPLVPFASLPPPTAAVPGIVASPIVVDVDGDSDFEIFVGSRNGSFYGFHHDATSVVGLPYPTLLEIHSTAAAGDLDHDGDVDVAFASFDGSVHVLDFAGSAHFDAFEWPTYAGNNRRTSVYDPGLFVSDAGVADLGGAFGLAPSFPNPFVSSTTIDFTLERPEAVSLSVYDVSGRLVRTLLRETLPAGAASVTWNGHDASGRVAAPGVYFYRLETATRSVTQKAVRLR